MSKLSLEELFAAAKEKEKGRYRPSDVEHQLQCICVRWFGYEYPKLRGLLFAVPNGGRRDPVTGAKLKAEGVVPGVSDLLLFVPAQGYHALCIEMKRDGGKQSIVQKKWQALVERRGYKYVVCRSLDEFRTEVTKYLREIK